MSDFLFRGSLKEIDNLVDEIIGYEAERQVRKLILIPSESISPLAVRECLGSVFQNVYAEGYPDEETRWMDEKELVNYSDRLTHFHRYSDPRYYKGVEFADVIESLARRRCAELFSTKSYSSNDLFVNVQPLSGAPANNAVYQALINPGDTIMGMNLFSGGHLTHGSSVNRSGKLYKVIHYNVNAETEKIDYDALQELAIRNKPRVIIAGYSSYPWVPDWKKFREIANSVGAYLFADVSHIAGMIAARVIPSPVGFADVITFTTHKTLCGPRGACILTTNESIAKKIDKAVFPGEQGGPHVNVFAALAVTFKLAATLQFKDLQKQIIKNCQTLSVQLEKRGFRIAYGGTNTHLTNIDCKSIKGQDGATLSGDMASRILDIVGIVSNPNTIPGDKSAQNSSGLRLGTPWLTQRGLKESDMVKIANIIADVLFACQPYKIEVHSGSPLRAKVDFRKLEDSKIQVREIADHCGTDLSIQKHNYPFFYYMDSKPQNPSQSGYITFEMKGPNIQQFMNFVFTADLEDLKNGDAHLTKLVTTEGSIDGTITRIDANTFNFTFSEEFAGLVSSWLRDLSDGYIFFDIDLARRIPGPIIVNELSNFIPPSKSGVPISVNKPYYIGVIDEDGEKLPSFEWVEKNLLLKRTPLYETHQKLSAKIIPFAGWEMPVWYTSVTEEHQAVRQTAGLFDVAHMGVYQAEGMDAVVFLDSVCANDIAALNIGESCYTHFLDPDANVIDDLLVYHYEKDKFLLVVNASNDDKDWAWLNSVLRSEVLIDRKRPWARAFGRNVILRNLRDPKEGVDMRVDLALQGPRSKDILLSLPWKQEQKNKIVHLKRTQLCSTSLSEMDLIVSRTGYTGEKEAYELFVHPNHLKSLWNQLLINGKPFGIKPCGLGARDSLRTEAGLPLYGHEMSGELNLGVGEAGFSSYVKIHKPWFIGRDAFIEHENNRHVEVIRFKFTDKHIRMAHLGDPVLDDKGKVVGIVTSCSIDQDNNISGQAVIDFSSAVEGNKIFIYQGAKQQADIKVGELLPGIRSVLPAAATILSRFPK